MAHFRDQQREIARQLAALREQVSRLTDEERQMALMPMASGERRAVVAAGLMTARAQIAHLESCVSVITDDDVFLVQTAALCHDLGECPPRQSFLHPPFAFSFFFFFSSPGSSRVRYSFHIPRGRVPVVFTPLLLILG
jgi:hypothetical protein